MADYSSCSVTSCIELGCIGSVGGIKKAYILNGSVTGVTYDANSAITGITGNGTLYTFEVQKQSSSLTETFNNSLENGTLFYQQDLVLSFAKIDQDKRNQMKLLAQNRGLIAIVEDNNGELYVLGTDFEGGYLSAGTSATGTAFGDKNAYDITLSFFSKEPMNLLGASLSSVLSGITVDACA